MEYLLSTAYLPNLDYMSVLLLGGTVWLEGAENYQKQSYRNRAMILSPNGVLVLAIPVCHDLRHNVPVKEVRISEDHPWQRMHWRSLESCYRSSSYFEFFEHAIRPFYEKPHKWLFDYNYEWLLALCKMMGIKSPDIRVTEVWHDPTPGMIDLRMSLHPKRPALSEQLTYNQLFPPAQGFEGRLSFVDLLFNEGRNSIVWLGPAFTEIDKRHNTR